eukprot:5213040-Ditylum_brightwellii.AAC.1
MEQGSGWHETKEVQSYSPSKIQRLLQYHHCKTVATRETKLPNIPMPMATTAKEIIVYSSNDLSRRK